MKYLLLSLLTIAGLNSYAQNSAAKDSAPPFTSTQKPQYTSTDRQGAILITDSISGPFKINTGYGRSLEGNVGWKYKGFCEQNSKWFTFVINHSCNLTFDIVPVDPKENYDFVLYRINSPTFLATNSFSLMEHSPLRWCYSVNTATGGSTGLADTAQATHENQCRMCIDPPYQGRSYVKSVQCKGGDKFYLMVNSETTKGKGFTIRLHSDVSPRPEPIILKNVQFETGKAILLPSSFTELDGLVKKLKENPSMEIEISGYTDNVGNEVANKNLSVARAKAVHDYIISKGIVKERLSYKGYGSASPIASNDTEEGRAKNRRVEFSVTAP